MMNNRYKYDESKLRDGQREAALRLVEYDFTPKGQRTKTKDEIAADLGITRKTLYNWDTRDQNFINYKNSIASDFMDSKLSFVYGKLIQSIDRNSVKGIELYMKRGGDLADQQDITIHDGKEQRSFAEREAELLKRLSEKADEVSEKRSED